MTLYEIEQAITNCVDPETGEIDTEALEALQMERDKKIENIACWIKDLNAEAKALKEEADKLTQRRKTAENKSDSLKQYLAFILEGERFKTAKASISYRNSFATEIEDEDLFILWANENRPDLLTYKAPEPNKTMIKDALTKDEEVRYATLKQNTSVIIK